MSKMYYAETPDAAHDIHDLKVKLLGESFQFYTDAGVFSKKMIDFGSQVLLSAVVTVLLVLVWPRFKESKSL